MEALLILILVTLLSDVYLQGNGTVELRKDEHCTINRIIGNLIHFVQIFIPVTTIMTILYSEYIGFIKILSYTLLICIVHIAIDIIKCWICKVVNNNNKFKSIKKYNLISDKAVFNIILGEDTLFFIDQILHLMITIFICNNSKLNNITSITYIEQDLFYKILLFIIVFIYTVRCGELYIDLFLERAFQNLKNQSVNQNTKEESTAMLSRLIYSIDRAVTCLALNNGEALPEEDDFNRQITEPAITKEDDETKNKNENISRYIGILERCIVMILVISNNYSSIAIILTGKSLARMGDFKDRDFAVKFIVGTFLSIFIGIIGGESFKFIVSNFI